MLVYALWSELCCELWLGVDVQWRLCQDAAWPSRCCHLSPVWRHANYQRLHWLYSEVLGPSQSMQCQGYWLESFRGSHWCCQVLSCYCLLCGLMPTHEERTRLSLPWWLVTLKDSLLIHKWSPITVLGAVGSDVDRINEVTLRRARLVLGWVTVSAFNSRCG